MIYSVTYRSLLRLLVALVVLVGIGSIFAQGTNADTLQNASDIISTSQPSTSSNPIKATHTITFTTVKQIPADGRIYLKFSATNTASPSATAFDFNNISTTQIQANNATCSFSVNTPTITCGNGVAIAAGTTVSIIIGCTAQSQGTCTNKTPTLINPTKTAALGIADTWGLQIKTQDANGTDIDTVHARIGTIDQVQVQATVATSLTFSIAGILNGLSVNSGNPACSETETTNSGYDAEYGTVNLGKLLNTPSQNTKISNISAQLISVTTNAGNGYSLTATSSGHLSESINNYAIADSATPSAFPISSQFFGLHPCGKDVPTATWNTGSDQTCNTYTTGSGANLCEYAWPSSTQTTLATAGSGPIGNDIATGSGMTSVEYAAGVDDSVPAGSYSATIIYTVVPTF